MNFLSSVMIFKSNDFSKCLFCFVVLLWCLSKKASHRLDAVYSSTTRSKKSVSIRSLKMW